MSRTFQAKPLLLRLTDDLDCALSRAWEVFGEDLSDQTDAELNDLLPPLVTARYVQIDGESHSGSHWRFTAERVERAEALRLS